MSTYLDLESPRCGHTSHAHVYTHMQVSKSHNSVTTNVSSCIERLKRALALFKVTFPSGLFQGCGGGNISFLATTACPSGGTLTGNSKTDQIHENKIAC